MSKSIDTLIKVMEDAMKDCVDPKEKAMIAKDLIAIKRTERRIEKETFTPDIINGRFFSYLIDEELN